MKALKLKYQQDSSPNDNSPLNVLMKVSQQNDMVLQEQINELEEEINKTKYELDTKQEKAQEFHAGYSEKSVNLTTSPMTYRGLPTGAHDVTGKMICVGDKILIREIPNEHTATEWRGPYEIKFGVGSYDSGVYKYIGVYVENIETKESDALIGLMFDGNHQFKIIDKVSK
ncbi:hypothetical protein KAU11_08655 [Candidatus Babeliales bacterium]|nr:hypothetical protein [Candidatus Babeliales bacterium]